VAPAKKLSDSLRRSFISHKNIIRSYKSRLCGPDAAVLLMAGRSGNDHLLFTKMVETFKTRKKTQ